MHFITIVYLWELLSTGLYNASDHYPFVHPSSSYKHILFILLIDCSEGILSNPMFNK